MSTGGARRGRRDNGLDAADYAAAGDVDPRVGEHLLDVLALDGIAAYLQPSADQNPILRATTYPVRPTDRLFVDRVHLAEARATLNRLTSGDAGLAIDSGGLSPDLFTDRPDAGGSQGDVDAEWAKIIAGFNETIDPTTAPWPASEGLSPDPTRPPDPSRESDPARPPDPPAGKSDNKPPASPDSRSAGTTFNRRRTDRPEPESSLLDGLDTFGAGLDPDEERYVPPPPPPLPRISKYAVAGVLAIIVGFVLFLRPTLLPIDRDFVTLIGFSAVIGGAVTLVWRLRSGDDDDDYDDGAVV